MELRLEEHGEGVSNLLYSSFSGEGESRPKALACLNDLQKKSGFHLILLQLAEAPGVHHPIRLLASICLKHATEEKWIGRGAEGQISEQEKTLIRERIIGCFMSENQPSASLPHLALCIANIARRDYPTNWPSLLPSLVVSLREGEPGDKTIRLLMLLDQILKKLCGRALPALRRQMAQVGPEVMNTVLMLANFSVGEIEKLSQLFFERKATPQEIETKESTCTVLKYCIKILSLLSLNLLPSELASLKALSSASSSSSLPSFPPCVAEYVTFCQKFLGVGMGVKERSGGADFPLSPMIFKQMSKIVKSLTSLLARTPAHFLPSLPPFLNFFTSALLSSSPSSPSSPLPENCEVFLESICCFLVLCVDRRRYDSSLSVLKDPLKSLVISAVNSVLKEEGGGGSGGGEKMSQKILFHLVSQYYPLTEEELETWLDSPEEYYLSCAQQPNHWKNDLKSASQMLVSGLLEQYSEDCLSVCLSLMSSSSPQTPTTPPSLLDAVQRDAVYMLVGDNMMELYDQVPLDWVVGFLPHRISFLAGCGTLESLVEMRRSVWMLGKWVAKTKGEQRIPLYECIRSVLAMTPPSDNSEEGRKKAAAVLVVGMEGCASLKQIVEDSWFELGIFSKFSEEIITLLFSHLERYQNIDSKMEVLEVLTPLVERCASKISTVASQMLNYFVNMWASSGTHQPMRLCLLDALSPLVSALGPSIHNHAEMICQIIMTATNPNEKDFVFLLESGLALWEVALEHIPSVDSPLCSLFSHLHQLILFTFEGLPESFSILSTYLSLPYSSFLQQHFESVVNIYLNSLGNVDRPDGRLHVLRSLNTFIQVSFYEREGFPVPEKRNSEGFVNLLRKVVEIAFSDLESFSCVEQAITALIRIQMANPDYFFGFCSSSSSPPANLACQLLDLYLSQLDAIGDITERKRVAVSLSHFFGRGEEWALERHTMIVQGVVSVILDFNDPQKKLGFDSFFLDAEEDSSENESLALKGKRMLFKSDPAFCFDLKNYLKGAIEAVGKKKGVEVREMMGGFDNGVIQCLYG